MDRDRKSFVERRTLGCSEVEELLDSYIDNEISPMLAARFEQHIDSCEYCHALVAESQHLLGLARTLAETPMPAEVGQRLRGALKERVGYELGKPRSRLILLKS
jgi:anti-sigma factor RsiW